MPSSASEVPDSGRTFVDTEFMKNNADIAEEWISIRKLYPSGVNQPLLPETFSREQFGQGNHYECFMLSALSTLVRFPEVIRNCFISKKVRQDGRYTFQFFRGKEWVKVEIDDRIAMEEGNVLYCQSPTEHWWPLLLEKAYAKFYTAYDHLEGCTLQETFHDLTGNPVLNIPMDPKLAKAANCNVLEGRYWLDLAQRIQSGEFVASALTKDIEVENMGLQREQQYGILDLFSISGTSAVDEIVVHLHNPFEDDEFIYTGPLNRNDTAWTEKQRAKHDVDNPRSIFLPLNIFLRVVNSMQLCYISTVEPDATYFEDEWKGETAGGNPTFVTWRKNPLYYISNHGTESVTVSFVIKQEDQRHLKGPEEETTYMQCGMILCQYSYLYPIPTFWVTGNNHKPIHKSLFLNSREVANSVIIPPQSLCYLVPSCMRRGEEAPFLLAAYRMANEDYSDLTIKKLEIPTIDWRNPAYGNVELQMRTKDRLDFYVDEASDVHILMHQTKPFISPKTGGDAMAQDYMGMYLYDDTDRKIAGVHAATNFRETSIIHHLPRSGRYAISLTCPRGKGNVPAAITIVASFGAQVRRVETPADAGMLPDELEVIEEDSENIKAARIDYVPFKTPASDVREVPDSNVPFEDRAFMLDNRDLTPEPWVHIGDLYPEGKTKPLLPDMLRRDQFEQGEAPECCCLTAFATLAERHPDVIRNCFISKKPRKDGRYTFQFHRYGQWVKVEIDDRIPKLNNNTLFCRSPTHHWWPLLLEKAYAKFYVLYDNLDGCSLAEVYHDFSGCPVVNFPLDPSTAQSAGFDVTSPDFWMQLGDELPKTAIAAQSMASAGRLGVMDQQFYGILDIISVTAQPQTLADVVIQLHNPFRENAYSGPMANKGDRQWAAPQLRSCQPAQNTIYMPADVFVSNFFTLSQAHLRGLVEPGWNFNSEWGDGTNGGNPSLLTWRENPLYVVRNASDTPVEIMGMIRQPDKRHQFHLLAELNYVGCDLLLAQSMENSTIPTYLVTHNNHRIVHKGVFLNYREVASFIAVPPHSLCYLVPTAMYHEKSIFMLSYWYKQPADERAVSIVRLKTDVARDLPAVKHVTMLPGGKDRVDFLVDVPTDTHILLSQWNHDGKGGNDVRTENYVGMYLYDDANQQVARVSSASSLKEVGLVTHLPAAGHYVLSLTCPEARDAEVRCRVEIVCVEPARVRITDAYENAPNFDDANHEPPVQPDDIDAIINPNRYICAVTPSVAVRPAVNAVQQPVNAAHSTPATREEEEEEEADTTPSLSFLHSFYNGVPKEDIPLMENPAFVQMARERQGLMKCSSKNASRIHALEGAMHDMAEKMADDMHRRERAFLEPEPEGVPLELLNLNNDKPFTSMEHDLRVAMKDAKRNRDDVAKLQDKLINRAREMAKELKDSERERFLNPMPHGIPISDLPLDEDPQFHALEVGRLRERAKQSPDLAKIAKMEEAMNARAEELALEKLADNRGYLKPEHLHVANEELPLDTNRDFVRKEVARRELLKRPQGNARAVTALEQELNDMAEQMAADLLAKQRPGYLDYDHQGRLIDELPLNDDDAFLQLERDRRDLLKEPRPDMAKIASIEDELNARANVMAKAMNKADRPQYLKPNFYGKPVEEPPLDDDPQIAEWEAQRARLRRDPAKNASAIRALEDKINARAAELAKAIVDEEWRARYGEPGGIPVKLLGLDRDHVMRRLEEEYADLLNMKNPDSRAIAAKEAQLNARVAQLAQAFVDNLYADIIGEHVYSPSVISDAPLNEMVQKVVKLMAEDQEGNKEQIADLHEAVEKRYAVLKKQRATTQLLRSFLDPKPLGISIEDLNLDNDPEFMRREEDLKAAKAANASPATVQALQNAMQQRVNELAAEELARRYPYIDTKPANMLLQNVTAIGKDKQFWEAIHDAEEAKRRNDPMLRDTEEHVNECLRKLAEDQKWPDREELLGKVVNGVPLRDIGLDGDAAYLAMEDEWRDLRTDPKRNAAAIADIEKRMKDRASKLADDKKWADREELLGKSLEGVPLRDIGLDGDAAYLAMEDEWRDLRTDPKRNAAAIADIEKKMKDRARELADEMKWADREELLGKSLEGVPLRDIGLDGDAAYLAMEDEWRDLKQDPGRNARRIADVEKKMKDRACELAKKAKEEERDKYLPRLVAGVEREALGLDDDKQFKDLETQRRQLIAEDPRGNAAAIARVEDALRARAEELAAAKKEADRKRILDPEPEGVKRKHIDLDHDPEFTALESEWRDLMQDPRANARRIADAEKKMNDRAHALANEMKWADREELLGKAVNGVPLRDIGLDGDAAYLAMEDEWRDLRTDPKRNAAAIADIEKKMKDRARELADEMKWADREELLGKSLEGVPLRDIGLDGDAAYLAMEDEWRDLKQDPGRNARRIADIEKKMKDRARELADEMKWADREELLGKSLEGVPLRDIGLDGDAAYLAMEDEWRDLKQDPGRNARRIADVEKKMKDRACELAKKAKEEERDKYLPRLVAGVEREALGLDDDKQFKDLETQRRQLIAEDPRGNAAAIARVEDALRARAEELAAAKKEADRKRILDPEPEGVKRKHIDLDHDPEFTALESEWRDLMQDPRANARRIADAEKKMNDRAHALANEMKWADREELLGKAVNGVPLRDIGLDGDAAYLAMEDEWRDLRTDPKRNAAAIADIEKKMKDRASKLADDKKWADREELLGKSLEGVPLRDIGLDGDAAYLAMEDEWRDLKQDPGRNARRIADVEKKMKDRACELAKKAKEEERDKYLPRLVAGVEREALGLDDDKQFKDLETQRRQLIAEDPRGNAAAIARVEDALRARAEELAAAKKEADRKRILDPEPEGVKRKHIDLDHDPEFTALESEWRDLMQDPRANARRIADAEKKMNDRAHALANEMKWADREELLGKAVNGVPLRDIGLDGDAAYLAMEDEWRDLKQDPGRNARRIADVEKKMKDRACELAKKAKEEERDKYLPRLVAGVEREALGLDDKQFKDLETQRRQLIAEDPRGNAAAIARVEDALRARAEELAAAKKEADRKRILDPEPEGVKRKHIDLDHDPEFTALESEWRDLMQDPRANARRIADAEKKMNDRAHALANEMKWADREELLGKAVNGVPLRDIGLDGDAAYLAMEDEWRDLRTDPKRNAAAIADIEKKMKDRARELADEMKWADREELLGKSLEGVPLRDIGLDGDAAYLAMEDEWRDLKQDPGRNARRIADIEKKMKDRARELADEMKWADREELLGKSLEGVPLRDIGLDGDAAYLAMEDEWRDLKQDPGRNARRIADVEKKMKDRACELAKKAKEEERDKYLPRLVAGVEREALGLDDDKQFKDLETQRRQLIAEDPRGNAAAIARVEDALRARAEELAAAKKEADRKRILDPEPEGVKRKHIDLDHDPEFTALESEWRDLMQDPRANARRIADAEKKMNDRAHALANEMKWADREELLGKAVNGVPLRDIGLDGDAAYLAMEDEWRDLRTDPKRNAAAIADIEKKMKDRASKLADDKKWADREELLGKSLEGVPLRDIGLDGDAAYLAMEDEWRDLKQDPGRNARRIADIEKKMKDRARELADEMKWADREELLGKSLEGVPLRDIGLDGDAAYLAMEDEWRDLKQDPGRNARRIADVEKKMKDRACELAKKAKEEERDKYLPRLVAGVEREALGLDDDKQFKDLETQRRQLIAEDPRGNAAAIARVEDALRARAEELAAAKKEADRKRILDPEPEGVKRKHIDLDHDPEFTALESEWRDLMQDPRANARRIADAEKKMNDRAHALANEMKWADREELLGKAVNGVPLRDIGLDGDAAYLAMEDEWRDLRTDPKRNAAAIADIEKKMKDRASKLADDKKWADREELLGKSLEGVPLRDIGLDGDAAYLAMEDEWRDLKQDPGRNARRIADIEKKMKDRARELADEMKWADREELLGKSLEGVPLRDIGLDGDAAYLAMEDEWRDLKQDPGRNARRIADVEKKMKDRACELAKKAKEEERDKYLPRLVAGVEREALGLDDDKQFKDLETQRRQLIAEDPRGNAAAIARVEDALRARAEELAAAKKEADRKRILDPEPEGVKRKHIDLDHDPEFTALESEWRDLMQDPRANARRIADAEKKMNDRAHALANEMKWADREELLGKAVNGVPLRDIGLDGDAAYLAMEDEWRDLRTDPKRNAAAIADIEKKMKDRARELADEMKWADREELLGKSLEGVPLRDIGLDGDAAYLAMEDEWRDLKQDPGRNARRIADIEKKMKDRARELADEMKWADREELLGKSLEGVPLRDIGLDGDAAYLAMEDEWRDLKQDPGRNARRIADVEKKMKDRACELAKKAKEEERDKYLPRLVAGVEREALGLDDDKQFKDLETQRRQLIAEDPRGNAAAIARVEDALRARAEELAAAKKEADRKRILDPEPEGVKRKHIDLDHDPEFTALESEWRDLMQDPRANARRIADAEKKMNDRAHALANEMKWADREELLGKSLEGVPLRDIGLDGDAAYLAMEDEWRDLRTDPKRNAAAIARVEDALRARAEELAAAKKEADRKRILDPEPEGVKRKHIDLDHDPEFTALESEWRDLMQDPRANARRIADAEKKMNDRAHALANEMKWADREELLGKVVNGVPPRDIGLDGDAAYLAMEDEWRDLKQDPGRNVRRIADVEKKMKDRACELAKKTLMEKTPLPFREAGGVPVELLDIENDAEFQKIAEEYARKRRDPRVDLSEVRKLEKKMRDRAEELARLRKDEDRRRICGAEMDEMLDRGAELDRDEMFLALERERYHLEAADPVGNQDRIRSLEEAMRRRARELSKPLLRSEYRGIPVQKIKEFSRDELRHKHPGGHRCGRSPQSDGEWNDPELDKELQKLADEMVDMESYSFLGDNVHGVPVNKIPFRKDQAFNDLADEWRRVVYHPERYPPGYKEELEEAMRRRVGELADQYKRDHPKRRTEDEDAAKMPTRTAAKPSEAPREGASGPRRLRDKKVVKEIEERTEEHRMETVEEAAPFIDPSFHSANKQVADLWPRIADIYPEGVHQPLLPDCPKTSDVASPAGDLTYLAPFLAALSRQPPLLHRLFQTKTHPVRAPYSFIFFDPNSTPVTVEIDDRIPCDEHGVPRFTVSPNGAWWPLLLEKAYAKYVGGYERFDDCTSHETLRDLTGRPVTHLPLDMKLASEVANCNYRDVAFWRRIRDQLEKGDVFMAVSNDVVPDGIHPHCYYAVFDVIETVPGSNDPSDVVVKIHNCYHDAPEYLGPLCTGDQDWTPTLRSVCKANPENEPEFLYLPQPIFLRNFSSMQRCHINCGDRLTVSGEWNESCSGGSPKYTTFRENPMYLVQNTSGRVVTVLAELRHTAPVFYDAHDVGVYHQSALALLRPDSAAQLVAPLLAHNTHRFVQKGLLTDAREVCAEMELPANSTCYLVPYTKKKGCFGKYQLSVYPQDNPVTLTTLRPITETHNCMAKDVVVQPGSGTSARVDITVSEPCDIHVLLHQNKVTDPASTKRGDHLAEDDIFMAAYEDNSILVSSSGDASNAREHAIAFQAAKAGRYTFLIGCPSKPVTGSAPCTLYVYTPKYAQASFLAVHETARANIPGRLNSSNAIASIPPNTRMTSRQPQAPPRPSSATNGAGNAPRNPRSRGYSQ